MLDLYISLIINVFILNRSHGLSCSSYDQEPINGLLLRFFTYTPLPWKKMTSSGINGLKKMKPNNKIKISFELRGV